MPENTKKIVVRGDNLHNTKLNLTGFVIDASNKEAIKIRSVLNEGFWKLSDCELLD